MTLVIDAGPLVASADLNDPRRLSVQGVLRREAQVPRIPAPVTAEVDYLLGNRVGRSARVGFLGDLAAGRLVVETLDRFDHRLVVELEQRYADLGPGLADLSIVVLAYRLDTRRLLTFDERHFRTIEPLQGGSFTLLPADASMS